MKWQKKASIIKGERYLLLRRCNRYRKNTKKIIRRYEECIKDGSVSDEKLTSIKQHFDRVLTIWEETLK